MDSYIDPLKLIMQLTFLKILKILCDNFCNRRFTALQENILDPWSVCGSADMRSFAVECFLHRPRERRDVVREEKVLFLGDPHTVNVNSRRILVPLQDLTVFRFFKKVFTGES